MPAVPLPLRLAALAALLGCRAEPLDDPSLARSARAGAAAAGTAAAPAGKLDWGDQVKWHGWPEAQALARAEGKAIGLVVYADWCEHCQALAPVFASAPVAAAASQLVMVRQDQDARPDWLVPLLEPYGSYLPRVLFFAPDGSVRRELTSGHPRYPYFYAPMVQSRLVANMRAASEP
jgi:thiol:disulfide interchange protein